MIVPVLFNGVLRGGESWGEDCVAVFLVIVFEVVDLLEVLGGVVVVWGVGV